MLVWRDMRRVSPSALLLAACCMVWPCKADFGLSLKRVAASNRVKVVWLHNTKGGAFAFPPAYTSSVCILGFDTQSGRIDTICGTPRGYARPLITYDGARIVYSCQPENEIHVINWDGTGDTIIAKGIAGCLWYDKPNQREYVVYVQEYSIAETLPGSVFRIALTPPHEKKLLLDAARAGYSKIVPHWLGISSNGAFIGGLFPWPNGKLFSVASNKVVEGSLVSGCWASVACDTVGRLAVLDENHSGIAIKQGGGKITRVSFCPDNSQICETPYNMPKMASYNPQLVSFVDEGPGGDRSLGPGFVVVARIAQNEPRIVDRVVFGNYETDSPHDGPSDVWTESQSETSCRNEAKSGLPNNGGYGWRFENQMHPVLLDGRKKPAGVSSQSIWQPTNGFLTVIKKK